MAVYIFATTQDNMIIANHKKKVNNQEEVLTRRLGCQNLISINMINRINEAKKEYGKPTEVYKKGCGQDLPIRPKNGKSQQKAEKNLQ